MHLNTFSWDGFAGLTRISKGIHCTKKVINPWVKQKKFEGMSLTCSILLSWYMCKKKQRNSRKFLCQGTGTNGGNSKAEPTQYSKRCCLVQKKIIFFNCGASWRHATTTKFTVDTVDFVIVPLYGKWHCVSWQISMCV